MAEEKTQIQEPSTISKTNIGKWERGRYDIDKTRLHMSNFLTLFEMMMIDTFP